ncbi:M20/M25/M40 family metallo-hydrolase [Sphingomonas sp. R1]|uniref:M20/M25/M40 family metallo-hydrolase n=1 Tax=Sphingomonas sp. R1 TaxID=399176 RepID=UPI002224CE57|nr:M20/M25/M40 family metallo-hydrolase [Sphingomonas sp. R1]UYY78859.1 M20/M25/M40 family metallo-hydrolase [Sphingomonas sp. R1]
MRLRRLFTAAALVGASLGPSVHAQDHPQAEAQALELLKRGIGFRTVAGPGNQTPAYAAYLKQVLVAGGFAERDVEIVPMGDTAYLVARYRGTGKARGGAKPLLISGHMDVVEAKPADWTRDPFTAVIENGYVYGRGATDMKYDLSTMVATLIDLKRTGFTPGRDIVLLLSGDEETMMRTAAAQAERFADAELLLNIDGGGGRLDEAGKPLTFGVDGAEKTYADYELTFTNPGGHSSAPRKDNAIYALAHALAKIEGYAFPGQVNEITRASWSAAAAQAEPARAAMIRRFLANQSDPDALAALRAEPGLVGQTGTTCVATMVTAGHATNALPQRATANINCRIFPGTPVEEVRKTLKRAVGDPALTIRTLDSGSIASPASPLRPDVMKAVSDAVHARFPGVPVVPAMTSGASDSMWFRAKGVPSYAVSPKFMKDSDDFSHGLNERTPVSEIAPSITYYRSLLTALAR